VTARVVGLLRAYPAYSGALATLVVTVASLFALPVTETQATSIVGAVGVLAGVWVHSQVTPVVRLPAPPNVLPTLTNMPPHEPQGA
jgi:hypothetical protein